MDWKQSKGGSSTFHAWWDKITEPWKKGQEDESKDDILSTSTSSVERKESSPSPSCFYIRPALTSDMGPASKILADGFFKDNTNFITFQFERLETYLSMEVGFPKPNTRHEVFVACEESTGKVLGVAEVDARPERPPVPEGGPYLCNLAVDLNHLRKGIASALVKQCESQVQEWILEQSLEDEIVPEPKDDKSPPKGLPSSLHLKVRQSNEKAIQMYHKMGYESVLFETDKKNQKVLVMRKQLEVLERNTVGVETMR